MQKKLLHALGLNSCKINITLEDRITYYHGMAKKTKQKTFEAQDNVPHNLLSKYKVSLNSVRLIPGPTDYRIAT